MPPVDERSPECKVLIAGGGVAALETAFALRNYAGDAVAIMLLAPAEEFVYRPMTVNEPFAYGSARRYPLKAIARDVRAELLQDAFAWVDAPRRVAYTESGREISYDALVLALGGRAHARYRHAITIDDKRMDELLTGLVQDVEGHFVRSLGFIVPPRMAWPLPIYELALMTAGRAYDMNVEVPVTVITPEDAPLAVFGQEASSEVSALLRDAGVTAIGSSYAEVPEPGRVVLSPGDRRLSFDRLVALPELFGPAVRGLPVAEHGFIPVDLHGAVSGVEHVYAAGDATDFAIKHGGIAAQQADAVAESIAAAVGVPIEPKRFDPVIRGMLLTDGKPRYLTAHITGGHGYSSTIADTPTSSFHGKIAARFLAPYLEQRDRRGDPAGAGR